MTVVVSVSRPCFAFLFYCGYMCKASENLNTNFRIPRTALCSAHALSGQ